MHLLFQVGRPMGPAAFMFELARFGLSLLGQDPEELAEDVANA
jgi:hypothetical protein